jgi:hypothetical protein
MHFKRSEPDYWEFGAAAAGETPLRLRAMGGNFAAFPIGEHDGTEPLAALLFMPPGFVLPRHCHPCSRLEVLISGWMQTPDGIVRPGDVMTTDANVFYGPHTAGVDGALTVEIFGKANGLSAIYESDPDEVSKAALDKLKAMTEAAGLTYPARQSV